MAGSSSCCRTSARSTAPSGNRSPSSRLMTRSILLVSAWSIASASSLSGHNQHPDHRERTLRSTSPARRILAPCRGRGPGLPLSAVASGTTMAVMDDLDVIAERYRTFADLEARGSSPSYEAWSRAVAGDRDLLAQLATLPARKQQPNLVFAALRWHGERPGDGGSLRHGLLDAWGEVRPTILGRATQTNEPARCAVLLPLLHRIGGPIALIELGAAARVCLIPDRYSYAYSDGTALHPPSGPSDVVIRCRVAAGSLPRDLAVPQIVWRAGVDLNPLDPADPDTAAWLRAPAWPDTSTPADRAAGPRGRAPGRAPPGRVPLRRPRLPHRRRADGGGRRDHQ